MEILIPVVALGSLYFINKKDRKEGFSSLPNTDIPDRNYPEYNYESNNKLDKTSELSVLNKTNVNQVYTDKYFLNLTGPGPEKVAVTNDNAIYKSLNGQDVTGDYFHHNNMTPFFGSKIRTIHTADDSNESILDSYSGTGSQIKNKKETSPLFAPENNTQWAYGMPSTSDFVQSRINPVLRQANVKPFEEIRVAPGIGLGYTSEGSGGFNNGVLERDMWKDYTVDQLRTANKPKASGIGLLGHEGPASHHVQYRGDQGIQEKHGPPTAFENGPDRYLKTTGVNKESTLIPVHIAKDLARPDTTVSYQGGAGRVVNGDYIPGEFNQPRGIEYGPGQFNPASAPGKGVVSDFEHVKRTNSVNNRALNEGQGEDYFGGVRGYVTEAIAPLLDILKPSRKENMMSNTRTYQNPKTAVAQPYIYNPHKAKVTIRQTVHPDQWKTIGAPTVGRAYNENTHQPANNARTLTGDFFYSGPSQQSNGQMRNYDGEYAIRNNGQKEKTIDHAYTPSGNTSLFTGNINMATSDGKENMFKNSRDGVPSFGRVPAHRESMGVSTIGDNRLYANTNIDRIQDTNVEEQLKDNPFFKGGNIL